MARHAKASWFDRVMSWLRPEPVRPSRSFLESHETRNIPPTAKHKVLATPRQRREYSEASMSPEPSTLHLAERYVEKMDAAFRARGRRFGSGESEAGRRRRINRISHYLVDAPPDVLASITYDDPTTLAHLAREEGAANDNETKWRGYH